MQISDLCSSCSKQNFCGNGMTDYYCTGYAPRVETVSDIKVPPFTDGQKEVIEATERIANGKLICDVDDNIDVMTNEEYIRQCSTEELAIFLCNELQDDEVGTLANRFDRALYSEYPIRPMNAYHEIMRWLKDKHEPLKNDEK